MRTSKNAHCRPVSGELEPLLRARLPRLAPLLWPLARRLLHLGDVDEFITRHGNDDPDTFISAVLDHFHVRVHAPPCPLPAQGPVILFANHPLGALDALSLLGWARQIRPDTRVLASRHLRLFAPLRPALIEVDNFSTRAGGHKRTWQAMNAHLAAGGVLLIFPAGEVSRLTRHGIRDRCWHTGFVRLARCHQAPLLPVRIHARNSIYFYLAGLVHDRLATALLPHQMYARQRQTIRISPGEIVAPPAPTDDNAALWTETLRQRLYRLP